MPSSHSALSTLQYRVSLGLCLAWASDIKMQPPVTDQGLTLPASLYIQFSYMAQVRALVQNRTAALDKHASSGSFRSLSHAYASIRALGAANRHTAIMARGRGPTGRMAIGLDGTREAAWRVIRHQSSVDSSDSWRMKSSCRP
ncbi:hypothetical protein GGI42DRAFT_91692 [Trichoderma sp. SZMC 28013]